MLLSRVLGLARDLLAAHLLGPAADVFLSAFRIPNILRRMLAEGSLGMAYGASVAKVSAAAGAPAAALFGRRMVAGTFLAALPLTAVVYWAAPAVIFAVAPGLSGELAARSAELLRLLLLYVPLCLASAAAFAHAAAFGRLLPQALSSVIFNTAALLVALPALLLPAVDAAGGVGGAELLLCMGMVAGGLAQAAIGLRAVWTTPCVVASPVTKLFSGLFRRAEERAFLKALPLSALGAAPHQLHILAGVVLASFLAPGGISAVYFAERLVELPVGVAGAAVGIVVLPQLSGLAAAQERKAFADALDDGIVLALFLGLPAAAGLWALSPLICAVLFGHGLFGPEAVAATASALSGYAVGIPALCASRPLLAAANALGRTGAPLKAAGASLCLLSAGGVAGIALLPAACGPAVLGWALALGAWTHVALLGRDTARALGGPLLSGARLRVALYALAAGAGALGLVAVLPAQDGRFSAAGALQLGGYITACVVGWFGVSALCGSPEGRGMLALLGKGGGKR